jgi:hypothetical protein
LSGRYDPDKLPCPSDLSDEEWLLVEPLIPPIRGDWITESIGRSE